MKIHINILLALMLLCIVVSCNSQSAQSTPTASTATITRTLTPPGTATLVPSDTPTVNYSTSLALTKEKKILFATLTPQTPTPTFTPYDTKTPHPTFTPTPTYDLRLLDDILSVYPLKVGDERVYEVTITFSIDYTEEGFVYDTWHGFVHEQVTEQYAIKDGIGFVLYYPDYPYATTFPDRKGEIGEFTKRVEFKGNNIYEYSDYPDMIYELPLEDGKKWLAFGADHPEYNWWVESHDDVETPAGKFSDCYNLSLITGPDSTEIVFCNGVGMVQESAWHHPPFWIYEWKLYQMP